jgi:hypothetical protein
LYFHTRNSSTKENKENYQGNPPWKKGEFMMFNATFYNISGIYLISWRSVLLVEETGVPVETHQQTLSQDVVSSKPRHDRDSNSQR